MLSSVGAAPATQAQKDDEALDDAIKALVAAKRGSDFMHKHPNPTAKERTEGYYLIAQCQDRLRRWDEAMISYAKAVMLGGGLAETATAAKEKERLERLYASLRNRSLQESQRAIAEPGK